MNVGDRVKIIGTHPFLVTSGIFGSVGTIVKRLFVDENGHQWYEYLQDDQYKLKTINVMESECELIECIEPLLEGEWE